MSGFNDVYVLGTTRTMDVVERFLAHFAPQREESADEYLIPQYSESPAHVFHHAQDVATYCVDHPEEPQALYWRCRQDYDPAHVMVFFTADRALILGLSVAADSQKWLEDLQEFVGSDIGCVLFEEFPPDSAEEFRRLVSKAI